MLKSAIVEHISTRPQNDDPFEDFLCASSDTLLRCVDIAISLLLLIFFLPLMIAIGLAIIASDPGPIFFVQRRVGLGGRQFWCLKFRTMVVDSQECLARHLETNAEARREWAIYQKLRNDPRIVGIGCFLRKSSFDELPQLFNVMLGDMSLVGPRPIVENEMGRYGRYIIHYCSVRPGITGLWQVSGRNDTTYRRRVACDVAYSRCRSTSVNLAILFRTVPAVVLSRGSY